MNLRELEYLQPTSILDCGANCGYWANEAKQVWPNAEIFLVEGNPDCQEMLDATGYDYTIALVSDEQKEVTFYQRKVGGTSTGDSLYRENTDWYNDENVAEKKRYTNTLDNIFEFYSFDLIKTDLQAGDLDALKGGKELVKRAKAVIMEVPVDGEHEPYNIGAPTQKEVMEYMNSIGFTKHQVLEDICHPLERYIIQQDVLFTRK